MFFPTGQEAESSSSSESPQPCRRLTFSEIQLATEDFDESLVIGRGGFGKVYKGTIINGARLLAVAIKRLDSSSNQGAVEFWAEVEMLSKLRHCHLVSLIGYCNDRQEMILVYDYMPHGTLEDHLHKRLTPLPWVRRLKICIGAARGLDYLHTGTGVMHGVIHRDVKCSNILLHDTWAAKISDFGLSKIGPTNQPTTYVNTFVKGTFGYLDPDYFSTGRLTRKSDVYAFGVVLFEVLCGKRAVDSSLDEEHWGLARWAQDSIKEDRLNQIVDPNIRRRTSSKCLKDFARLANQCLHSHPKQRPTMAEVVVGLESILALQEKTIATSHPMGMTIFGRKVPMFLFPSNGDSSGVLLQPLFHSTHLAPYHWVPQVKLSFRISPCGHPVSVGGRSLKSLELYFDTVGGESRILHGFDFETISIATENFSEANKVSQYRFDSMYKGRLQNGQGITIAGPYSDSKSQEYINEASLLVKLEHENLTQLVGYCIERTKVYLVYEFASYTRLDCLIFDPLKRTLLDWDKRCKIIVGVAMVLVYLHRHAPIRIIHRNVNPQNIFLDESFDPKLSGFGCARCLASNETDCIDMAIPGTFGYIAPECLTYGRLSAKVDVFSFGMLVLETISGYSIWIHGYFPTNNENFLQYAWRNWWEGTWSNIVDPTIDADLTSLRTFIHIGLLCVQADETDRPTMEEVVGMLHGTSFLSLPVPKSPIMKKGSGHPNAPEVLVSDDYDSGAVEEFISELHAR